MYKIAITGKANSGKNTVSRLLFKELKLTTAKYLAFADPIKEMIQTAYPELPREWLYGSSELRKNVIPGAFKNGVPLTVRQLLIDIGNFGRAYKHDIWLRNFDIRLNTALKLKKKDKPQAIIVTDCRLRNEFDHLKSLGFYQIRLLRNNHAKINDISETNQDDIDDSEFNSVLYNNGTLEELENRVKEIVLQL